MHLRKDNAEVLLSAAASSQRHLDEMVVVSKDHGPESRRAPEMLFVRSPEKPFLQRRCGRDRSTTETLGNPNINVLIDIEL